MTKSFLPIAAVLLIFHQASVARTPLDTNRRIATNRGVNEIALSPNGRSAVAAITDATADGGRSHLWLLSHAAAPRQITGAQPGALTDESKPVWGKDGRSVLFLEKRGAAAVIRRLDIESGQESSLSLARLENSLAGGWETRSAGTPVVVAGFAPAPSGGLAVWAVDGPEPRDAASPGGNDQHLYGDGKKVRLYLTDQVGKPRELSVSDNVRTVAWSQDGRNLLVVTTPATDDLGALNRVWLTGPDKLPEEVRGTAENVQSASWLPDGRVVYFARCVRNAPTTCSDIFVQALDGSAPRNLTDGVDGSIVNGLDLSATAGPIVTRSGDVLAMVARHFDQQVARIDVNGRGVIWLGALPPLAKALTTNDSQSGFALLAAERGGVVQPFLADRKLASYAPLTSPELQPTAWAPLRSRRLQWRNEGMVVEGLLYLPEGALADQRVPLVVDVHGGPARHFEDVDYPLVRLLLEKGWAVLHVNPRGSIGYGTAFLAAVQDDLGGADYRDIMTGVDTALQQAPIDKSRMALIGFSYGGTMASFTLGRTDRFIALVAAAPVVNQISEYGTESSSWYDRWYFGQPWRRLEAAWRQSPLAGVAGAHTPLLLLHGENDPVDPLGQSLELYRALRQQNSPVELMLFPRETHYELGQNFFGYSSTEPFHGIALRQRILDFLGDAFSGKLRAGLDMTPKS